MKLFNTLTREKEEFIPVNSGVVNMYVCGPTVYDLFHIGNARTFIFFDVVRRYMEYLGYKVNFIQNFTDIDDKIILKANKNNKSISEVTEEYIREYYKDADNLNIKRASINPKATENVSNMVNLIQDLLKNGFAYEVEGNIYFSIKKFSSYGRLFGQDLNTLKSGSRVEVNINKRDPLDFILWKKSKDKEPSYISPWGEGRPGWHTECSAMIHKYFDGNTIDIHGGGIDLVFPHHENEIAQIESLRRNSIAKYWMHCAFLNIDKEKMSKSLNNFLTSRDLLNKYSSNSIRFFMLSSHYRNELNFSEEQIIWAEKSLDRIIKCYELILNSKSISLKVKNESHTSKINYFKNKFMDRMNDDFNTSDAISVIFEVVKYFNSNVGDFDYEQISFCKSIIEDFFEIFGIVYGGNTLSSDFKLNDEIIEMILKRYNFKKNKEFNSADLLRESLFKKGIVLEDISGGVRVLDSSTNILIRTILY